MLELFSDNFQSQSQTIFRALINLKCFSFFQLISFYQPLAAWSSGGWNGEVGTFWSCNIFLHGKAQKTFRNIQFSETFKFFRIFYNVQNFQNFLIFRNFQNYCTCVLANFPFPSTLLKAQEYFGCGW